MDTKSRKTAGILALSALVAGSVGLAGCGTSAASGVSTGSATGTEQGVSSSSSYEVECRRGIVNDPYPGLCREYVDADGNGICDLSEPDTGASSQAALVALGADDADDDSSGGCPLAPCVICGICANLG